MGGGAHHQPGAVLAQELQHGRAGQLGGHHRLGAHHQRQDQPVEEAEQVERRHEGEHAAARRQAEHSCERQGLAVGLQPHLLHHLGVALAAGGEQPHEEVLVAWKCEPGGWRRGWRALLQKLGHQLAPIARLAAIGVDRDVREELAQRVGLLLQARVDDDGSATGGPGREHRGHHPAALRAGDAHRPLPSCGELLTQNRRRSQDLPCGPLPAGVTDEDPRQVMRE